MAKHRRCIAGWTLIRSVEDLRVWENENTISYCGRADSYPCLVREIISSDENTQTDILVVDNVQEMLNLLLGSKG